MTHEDDGDPIAEAVAALPHERRRQLADGFTRQAGKYRGLCDLRAADLFDAVAATLRGPTTPGTDRADERNRL